MFAILFEVLFFVEIQEEIHHFAGWEGLRAQKIVIKIFVNKLAFPKNALENSPGNSAGKDPRAFLLLDP